MIVQTSSQRSLCSLFSIAAVTLLVSLTHVTSTGVTRITSSSLRASSNAARLQELQEDRALQQGLIDLVDLVPFDVQIALLQPSDPIQMYEVTDLVTDWMNSGFDKQLVAYAYTEERGYAHFGGVILVERARRRHLQQQPTVGFLYTAEFKATALFSRNETLTQVVPEEDVLAMQRLVLYNNDDDLLGALRNTSSPGLGSSVVDVYTVLNPNAKDDSDDDESTPSEELEIVIVVAIAVAAVAFLFLTVAVLWAWRHDQRQKKAYMVRPPRSQSSKPDRTGSSSADNTTVDESPDKIHAKKARSAPPTHGYPDDLQSEAGGPAESYAESMLSEDISTSLSQYYRSGMGGTEATQQYRSGNNLVVHSSASVGAGHLNDAASVSSMESYGYSLDGYSATTPAITTKTSNRMMASTNSSSRGLERIGGLPVEPSKMSYVDEKKDDDAAESVFTECEG